MEGERCAFGRNIPLISRLFLSALFIVAGYGKLTSFAATAGYIGSLTSPSLGTALTVLVIIFELVGGLMLLFNIKPQVAAWMLIVFTILATYFGHFDFSGTAQEVQMQVTQILKNLAIIGGLLLVGKCPCCSWKKEEQAPTA